MREEHIIRTVRVMQMLMNIYDRLVLGPFAALTPRCRYSGSEDASAF